MAPELWFMCCWKGLLQALAQVVALGGVSSELSDEVLKWLVRKIEEETVSKFFFPKRALTHH